MSIPRILLVDDQREVSRMLRSSLELSGKEYVVVDVPSGEEALLELGRGPVDLLVTDLRLPGISGLELVEKVRQLNPDARAILITGHPTEEAEEDAKKLGVVAFLPKPIGTSIFLEAVEHALKLRGPAGSPVLVPDTAKKEISDRLKEVRSELGAEAALLIDDRRQVVVQAGKLMGLDLQASLPSLMTAFNAGLKVSNLVGSLLPGNLQYFDGDTHDLYLTNIGAFYALLIVFRGKQEPGRMGSVVHYGRRAAEDLMDMLSRLGEISEVEEEVSADLPPKVEWVEQTTGAVLESNSHNENAKSEKDEEITEVGENGEILDLDAAGKKVKREEAEQFWEQAASETPALEKSEGGILTYDEARDKGLLSEEKDEEQPDDNGG